MTKVVPAIQAALPVQVTVQTTKSDTMRSEHRCTHLYNIDSIFALNQPIALTGAPRQLPQTV